MGILFFVVWGLVRGFLSSFCLCLWLVLSGVFFWMFVLLWLASLAFFCCWFDCGGVVIFWWVGCFGVGGVGVGLCVVGVCVWIGWLCFVLFV